MKIAFNVIAGLLVLAGAIFFLQGAGFLLGSYMTGQPRWAIIGAISFLVGLALAAWNFRRI
jgi:hypothetical protein